MSSTLRKYAVGLQDIGGRAYQEDAFTLFEHGEQGQSSLVAILADGMGGHAAGDVAANVAVTTFGRVIQGTGEVPHQAFVQGLNDANRAIRAQVEADPARDGMGCTLVAISLSSDGLRWISVGDSLLLHVSRDGVKRLNADHSMAPRLDAAARRGEITHEEAASSPSRSALLSALTGSDISRVDLSIVPADIHPGDWLIVASDGLGSLELDEIHDFVRAARDRSPELISEGLVQAVLAKNRPRQDNVTVIAIDGLYCQTVAPAQTGVSYDSDSVVTRPLRR